MTAKLTNCELSFLTEKRRNIALSRRRNLARKVIIRRNEISCLQDKNLSFDEAEFRFDTKFRKSKVKSRLSERRNFDLGLRAEVQKAATHIARKAVDLDLVPG